MTGPCLDIHIFRHGQTESNRTGKVQGHLDSPLTPMGTSQAEHLGLYLSKQDGNFNAFYSSDLGRAVATAKIVSKAQNLPITVEPRLREICFGKVEGLSWVDIESLYPEQARSWHQHEKGACMPGGESRESIKLRLKELLSEWIEVHAGQKILVCTHGGIISCLAAIVLKLQPGQRPMLNIANSAIHHLRLQKGNWSIQGWGLQQ